MTSLYQQSIPLFKKYLRNLSGILEKGAKFCEEKGIKHEDMLSLRLIEDMRGIPFQVQSCCNTAKFTPERVGGTKMPVFEDNETTFEELQARITRTIEVLDTIDPKTMDGLANEEVIMPSKMGSFRFTGQSYISEYAIPNFHFHLTSAYCLLRHQGVPIGAFDYLKDVFVKVE